MFIYVYRKIRNIFKEKGTGKFRWLAEASNFSKNNFKKTDPWHQYSMVSSVGCLRFRKGYPCNLWPWVPQNSEISIEFEGSDARIVKNQWNLKVLGVLLERRRESLTGGTTARPSSTIGEISKRKVWAPRALPRTLGTYAPSPCLSSWTLPAFRFENKPSILGCLSMAH